MSARGLLGHPWAGLFVPAGAAIAAWIVVSILWPTTTPVGQTSSDPEVRLCDVAVDALLHSKDLIEITRAGIIVRERSRVSTSASAAGSPVDSHISAAAHNRVSPSSLIW